MKEGIWFHRSTPRGEGGIFVFELYGAESKAGLEKIFRPRSGHLPDEGRLRLGDLVDLRGEVIDECVLARVAPGSAWSKLPTWALSVHGGPWVQEKTTESLHALGAMELDLRGVLLRSLQEGSLDCIEAAAHELLVSARTEKAACFFARQHVGELSALLREGLEAVKRGHLDVSREIARSAILYAQEAYRLGHPLRVLIAGPPNAGKSTLFNRLAGEERAIVSPIPGTTRDSLEETVVVEGFPVLVRDSAGIRDLDFTREVERLGIERTLERLDDSVLYLIPYPWRLTEDDRQFMDRWPSERLELVHSLADLTSEKTSSFEPLRLSALRGDGVDLLKRQIVARWLSPRLEPTNHVPVAAFTPRLEAALRRIEAVEGRTLAAALDAHRSAYLECLNFSWPQ